MTTFWLIFADTCTGQGAGFTYQGRLDSNSVPVTGLCDFTFGLYSASSGGSPLGNVVTSSSVVVSNGQFTTTLDFGSAFNISANYWLEIAVRQTGTSNAFIILNPRQPITPVPYAITAANLSGALTSANLSGISSSALSLTNPANIFAGNGSGLSNLNLSSSTGIISTNSLPTNIPAADLMIVPPMASAILARTPAMGFNSWFNAGSAINELAMSNYFQRAVSNGMRDSGYKYFVVDLGWPLHFNDNWDSNTVYAPGQHVWYQGTYLMATLANTNARPIAANAKFWSAGDGSVGRTTNGTIIVGTNFPNGMAYLANMAHTNGLLLGLYTVGGTSYNGFVGSGGYEWQDGLTYASWGIDYVKIDGYRSTGEMLIRAMMSQGRQVWYSPTIDPFDPWVVGEASSWRGGWLGSTPANPDMIPGSWSVFCEHVDHANMYSKFAGRGFWLNPDALDCAGGSIATEKCEMAVFATLGTDLLWDSIPPPGDVRLFYMTNREAIAIDQDPGGYSGIMVASNGYGQVYMKPLDSPLSGKKAVCLFNRSTNSSTTVTVNWSDIGIPSGPALVRDVFQQANLGYYTNSYSFTLPPQDCQLLIITTNTAPFLQPGTNYLSDLGYFVGWTNSSLGGQPIDQYQLLFPGRDKCESGSPIRLHGVQYAKGVGVIANSRLQYALGGASRFHSDVGVDSAFPLFANAHFVVSRDGQQLWDSGPLGPGQVATVDVNVTGGNVLTLDCITTEPGGSTLDDVCDWAGAYLYYGQDPATNSTSASSSATGFTGTTLAGDVFSIWQSGILKNAITLPPGTTSSLYPVLSISGLGPYFDASVSSLVTITNSTNVLLWRDLAGTTNDAMQPTNAFQPSLVPWLSGKCVSFNNVYSDEGFTVTNYLTCKAPLNQSNFTMFALIVRNSLTSGPYSQFEEVWNLPTGPMWNAPFANLLLRMNINARQFQPFVNQQSVFSAGTISLTPQTNFFFLICSNGGSTKLYDGLTLLGSGSTPAYVQPSTQPFYLGGFPAADDLFQGSIAVLGYVNRPITTSEMLQIRTNIQTRFGLPVQ